MKIKLWCNMGYAGTDSSWEEEIPEEIIEKGEEAIDKYLEEVTQEVWQHACDRISVWVEIKE